MSGLMLDITYNQLIDSVANWLVTNCGNVGTMKLPTCFQANYVRTTSANGSGAAYTPKYTVKISNYVTLVTKATVVSELQTFIRERGITNLDSIIYDNNFLACVNNIVSFITTKVNLIVSPYSSATDTKSGNTATTTFGTPAQYTAYFSANTSFVTTEPMSSTNNNEKMITPEDMNQMFTILFHTINNKLHTKQIKYTVTFN